MPAAQHGRVLAQFDAKVARLGAGDLVGEMSFARRISDHLSDAGTKTVSRASVLPVDAVEYVAWPAKQLAQGTPSLPVKPLLHVQLLGSLLPEGEVDPNGQAVHCTAT